MAPPPLETITQSIQHLAARLQTVETESIPVGQAHGRVLADALVADRDSPALSVSAMDGYAVRIQDVANRQGQALPVVATAAAGMQPIDLPSDSAVLIFTGAAVPHGADCVIKREDTVEGGDSVSIQLPLDQLKQGDHIRSQGENVKRGEIVLEAGTPISPAAVAATASFGPARLNVRRKVRIAVLNTGDELTQAGQPVEDWQIRDSNGPVLSALMQQLPWTELVERQAIGDTLTDVEQAISRAGEACDAVVLTGGVSMGNADYVPEAIHNLGGEIVFHRLPLRPGKPVLGAVLNGKLVLGLPGNPVSVAVTSRVFGLPLLRRLAGVTSCTSPNLVTLSNADDRLLPLVWYRLVTTESDGQVALCPSRGSGDLVSLAQSDGFVEIPAGDAGKGPWKFTPW